MDDETRRAIESSVGRTITGADDNGGWPVILLDDGTRLRITDEDGIAAYVERIPPRA